MSFMANPNNSQQTSQSILNQALSLKKKSKLNVPKQQT